MASLLAYFSSNRIRADLTEDWVLIENTSRKTLYMSDFTLCDEERSNKLSFPDDLEVAPRHFLKVVCSPGRASNLDIFQEEDGRTTLLMWKTTRGSLRSSTVLREDGDCMYLLDANDNVASAFAKTDDGAFKEYGALNEELEQQLWRMLGLSCVVLRIALQCTAAFFSLHTNLSLGRAEGGAHPWRVVGPLLGAFLLDMLQREAVVYSHVHDFFGESLAVFSDRLGAMTLYSTLALFHGDYCGLLLSFLMLDFAACWFQLFASDCGELEIKALHGVIAQRFPRLLTVISIASEAFLLLLFVDHGAVQYRLFPGTGTAGSVTTSLPGFASKLLVAPLLTVPGVKDLLLVAFMTRQAMLLSQLWTCAGSMMETKPLAYPAKAGPRSFLLKALMERDGPNIELLRNSESLQTLRSQN
jgi:hypothetical protein